MPKYFFDIYDNGARQADQFGVELSGIGEARDQAIGLLPDIARDELPDGETHEFRCDVRSDANRIVYRAKLTLHAGPIDEAAPSN